MDVSFLLARLQSQLVNAGLKSIGGSADLDSAIAGALATPSMFVMPLSEVAAPSSMLSVTFQRQTVQFGVMTVVANRRDMSGKASLDELTPIRNALKAALIGWVPFTDNGEAVQFVAGRLLRFEEGRVWWTDQFSLVTYYQSP